MTILGLTLVGAFLGMLLLLDPIAWWIAGDTVGSLQGKERAEAINAVRALLMQGAAGLVAVAALTFTARTYLLSREGQVTDRYAKAIEHLGSTELAQRVGAVFALERIMLDSEKDHGAIVHVLASFVRVQSRVREEVDMSYSEGPGEDVKAALVVLGRRPIRPFKENDRIRLSDADLHRTTLRNARLDCVALRRGKLQEAHWEGTSLVGAKLRDADLTEADLEKADLRHASLVDAILTDTKLVGARLDQADIRRAKLGGANLSSAHLAGATITEGGLDKRQWSGLHCRPNQTYCPNGKGAIVEPCQRFEP